MPIISKNSRDAAERVGRSVWFFGCWIAAVYIVYSGPKAPENYSELLIAGGLGFASFASFIPRCKR